MPNFSFLCCVEVIDLWLETNKTRQGSMTLKASLAPAQGVVAKADKLIQFHWIFGNKTGLLGSQF